MTAKNASVVRNSAAETITNTGWRKSRSGRIGSATRRSCATNRPSSATAPAASPAISPESHAYWRPPQVVTSSRQVSPPASSAAPSESIRAGRRSVGRCSAPTISAIVAAPIGRLT